VDKLERLPDNAGHEVWRQFMGRNSFTLETTELSPPTRMVRTIADDRAMFSGNWTYDIQPDNAGGTIVTLTEHGHVPGRIPRFMMNRLVGYHFYLKKHLRQLAAHLGRADAPVETR
jgi:hypothetical protein